MKKAKLLSSLVALTTLGGTVATIATSCNSKNGEKQVAKATIEKIYAGSNCEKVDNVFQIKKSSSSATIKFALSEAREDAKFEVWTYSSTNDSNSSTKVDGVSVITTPNSQTGKYFSICISSRAIRALNTTKIWTVKPTDDKVAESRNFNVCTVTGNAAVKMNKNETFENNHCIVNDSGILIENSRDIASNDVTFSFTLNPWINNIAAKDLTVVGSDGTTKVATNIQLSGTTFTATIASATIPSALTNNYISIIKSPTSTITDEIEGETLSIAQEQLVVLSNPTPVANTGISISNNNIVFKPLTTNTSDGKFTLTASSTFSAQPNNFTFKINGVVVPEITAAVNRNIITVTIPRTLDLTDTKSFTMECRGSTLPVQDWIGTFKKESAKTVKFTKDNTPSITTSPTRTNLNLGSVKLYDDNGLQMTTKSGTFNFEVYNAETHVDVLDNLIEIADEHTSSGFAIRIKSGQSVTSIYNNSNNYSIKFYWDTVEYTNNLEFKINLPHATFSTPTAVANTGISIASSTITYKPTLQNENNVDGKFTLVSSKAIEPLTNNGLVWKVYLDNVLETGSNIITATLDPADTTHKTVLVTIPRKHSLFTTSKKLKIECEGATEIVDAWQMDCLKQSAKQITSTKQVTTPTINSTTSTTQDLGYYNFFDDNGDILTTLPSGTTTKVYGSNLHVSDLDALIQVGTYESNKGFKISTKAMPMPVVDNNTYEVRIAWDSVSWTGQRPQFTVNLIKQSESKASASVNISYINNNTISLAYANQVTTGIKVTLSQAPTNTPSFQVKIDGSVVSGASQEGSGKNYLISLPASCTTTASKTIEIIDNSTPTPIFNWSGTIIASELVKPYELIITQSTQTIDASSGSAAAISNFATFQITDNGGNYIDNEDSGNISITVEKGTAVKPICLSYTETDISLTKPSAGGHDWTLSLGAKSGLSSLNDGDYKVTITYSPNLGNGNLAYSSYEFAVANGPKSQIKLVETGSETNCTVNTTASPNPTVTFTESTWTSGQSAKFYIQIPGMAAGFSSTNFEIQTLRNKWTVKGSYMTIAQEPDNVTFCLTTNATTYADVAYWADYIVKANDPIQITFTKPWDERVTQLLINIVLVPNT